MRRTSQVTEYDAYLFHEGTNYEFYRKMGAHPETRGKVAGVRFILWAPNAKSVSVLCSRLNWDANQGVMARTQGGLWEAFVPGVQIGDAYKYMVVGADGVTRFKADPYAFESELRPESASIVGSLDGYKWHDASYMKKRPGNKGATLAPMSIYEVHLGSWKKDYRLGKDGFINYRRLADELSEYIKYMGYTHVELIGICEHPFDGSWGYQVTGFYAPTKRYGTPDDFRYFIDKMHQCNIGVILDWVPAHFPKDDFGLETFDGTPLYEPSDPLRAEYPEWGTKAFDHSKPEVRNYLIGSAFYWVNEFHIDALRVDAVAAMLYSSFGREKWRPNAGGGPENDESTEFLRILNSEVTSKTTAYLIAEDSSIQPGVTKKVSDGGLGFLFKWNMGWMNDTLKYVGKEPIYRGWHHDQLTHVSDYAFYENYVLVLSHDEVVHLKHSMLEKFPGNLADKFGGLKSLYTMQFTEPGKKLLFMGQDLAEAREWSEARELDWSLANDRGHRDVMQTVRRLNEIYRKYPALYTDSDNTTTFEWVNRSDATRNTISYIRRNPWNYNGALLVVCNFAPIQYDNYTVGVPTAGEHTRIFSTYDGEDGNTLPILYTEDVKCDGYDHRLSYNLRPYESIIVELD